MTERDEFADITNALFRPVPSASISHTSGG